MTEHGAGIPSGSMGDNSFNGILKQLKFAQKPGHGVPAYTRWINRALARGVAALCASWGWSANMVSTASALVTLAALALLLLLPIAPVTGAWVAILLAAGYVLDSADGQVARVTGTGSMAGEWLDHVIDAARTPAIHLCVAVGFIHLYGSSAWQWWIPLMYCVVSACHFMSQILAEQLTRNSVSQLGPVTKDAQSRHSSPTDPVSRKSFGRSVIMVHTDTGMLCWVFLVWGFPPLFLVLYLLLFAGNALTSAVSLIRKFRLLNITERSLT